MEHSPDLARALDLFASRLNPEQREVAETIRGRLRILAAAGTGKTTALVARSAVLIEAGEVAPDRLLLVTFTNKGAAEMQQRLAVALGKDRAPTWTMTFHKLGFKLLMSDPETAGLQHGFGIADESQQKELARDVLQQSIDDAIVYRILLAKTKQLLESAELFGVDPESEHKDAKRCRKKAMTQTAESLVTWISKLKDVGLLPGEVPDEAMMRDLLNAGPTEDVPSAEDPDGVEAREPGLLLSMYLASRYQAALRRANLADFGDLILWPARRLVEDEEWREKISRRWSSIMVDEYQDTSPLQAAMVEALAQGHNNIAICGDDDQSIFEWRSAKPEIIRNFPSDKTIILHRNYRSTAPIIDTSNAIISRNKNRVAKQMTPGREGQGHAPVCFAPRDQWEAARCFATIAWRAKEKGIAWNKMAILVRTARSTLPIEQAFAEAGVPCVIVGGMSFFERREVRDALSLLRLAQNTARDADFRRICNQPSRGLGDGAIGRIEALAYSDGIDMVESCRRLLAQATPGSANARSLAAFLDSFDSARTVLAGQAAGSASQTLEDRVLRIMREYGLYAATRSDNKAADEQQDAQRRLDQIASFIGRAGSLEDGLALAALEAGEADKESAPGSKDAVEISTIHKAKGREWDIVMLADWIEEIFPSLLALNEGREEEERRLAYVATSRARKLLYISSPKNYASDGKKAEPTEPSRFLEEAPNLRFAPPPMFYRPARHSAPASDPGPSP